MQKKTKSILSYIFWTAVAAVLVYFCLRNIDWTQFIHALEECRWEYVIASMLLGLLSLFLRGLRWRMLLTPIDPGTSILTCFNAYNICCVTNIVLPRAGEVVRLAYIVRHSSKDEDGKRVLSADKVFGTVVIERAWDIVFVAVLATLFTLLNWETFGSFFSELAVSMGDQKGLLWLVVAVLLFIPAFIVLARHLNHRGGIWAKTWGFLEGIGKGLGTFRHMKNGWLFLLLTVLIWFLYWAVSACILWALKGIPDFVPLTLTDALFLSIVGSIGSLVPVPGGFGAYHGLVGGALKSLWSIPMSTGMVYATLNHESQIIVQALAGLVSYVHESFFRKK